MTKKEERKKKLNLFFMTKSFFVSLVDPNYGKPDALGRIEKNNKGKVKPSNEPVSTLGFGFGGPIGGAAGPVCGPNGCH